MLTLENVSVSYGAIEALTGINLQVNQGEVVTLIGANGAGKTTTLRTITGLLEPSEGQITYEGKRIDGMAAHKLVSMGMAMSPEGRGVFANLSVRENLEMGAYIRNDKKGIADDMEKGFAMFPRLKEREQQKAGWYSGRVPACAQGRPRRHERPRTPWHWPRPPIASPWRQPNAFPRWPRWDPTR